MKHKLKIWPGLIGPIATGAQTFEIRKNDRDFKVGDVLSLEEYQPVTGRYTGDDIEVKVTYILHIDGFPGFPSGFVGMSIEMQPAADGAGKEE